MSEKTSSLEEIKQLIKEYLEARARLLKLEFFEKTGKVTATLFSSIVVALVAFFLLFFLSLSAGFFFGGLFGSMGLGFLLVTGIYVLLFIAILVWKKKLLEKYITDRVIEQLAEKDDEDE